MNDERRIIGVVGGVGPYAGLDLCTKIFDQTEASKDQEHLSVALLSYPCRIVGRPDFLQGKTDINPAYAVCEIVSQLVQLGAGVVGIPCNTMHSPRIFDVLLNEAKKRRLEIRILNMVEEVREYIQKNLTRPALKEHHRIGLLGTEALVKSGVYQDALQGRGLEIVVPDGGQQQMIESALFHPGYGIKARCNPVTDRARGLIIEGIDQLAAQHCRAIILGCSEISMVVTEPEIERVLMIDPTSILARALIREVGAAVVRPQHSCRASAL